MVLREKVKHPGEVCGARSCREGDSRHRRALFHALPAGSAGFFGNLNCRCGRAVPVSLNGERARSVGGMEP